MLPRAIRNTVSNAGSKKGLVSLVFKNKVETKFFMSSIDKKL